MKFPYKTQNRTTMTHQSLYSVCVCVCVCVCVYYSLSCVQPFVIPYTVACQAPLSWNPPGKNTGVGCHDLLQGIFLTQRLNLGLLYYRWILYHLSHWWNNYTLKKTQKYRYLYTEGTYCFSTVGKKGGGNVREIKISMFVFGRTRLCFSHGKNSRVIIIQTSLFSHFCSGRDPGYFYLIIVWFVPVSWCEP